MLEETLGPDYASLVSLLAQLRPAWAADTEREAIARLLRSNVLEVMRADGEQAAARYARDLLGAGGVRDQENLAAAEDDRTGD